MKRAADLVADMRRYEQMPTPGSIAPGQTATVNLPLGPTYHRLNIDMFAAAIGDTPVAIDPAEWADYIGEMRLVVNGDTRIEIDAADLVKINRYYGQVADPGVLPLFLSQPWMRTRGGEDNTAYGTAAGMASFTLELDLKPNIAIGKLEVYAVQHEPMPFGSHLRIQRFSKQMGLQGVSEVSDLPLGTYLMQALHLTTAEIDQVEILTNSLKVLNTSKRLRSAHQRVIGRVPQAGMTHIDFLTENRMGEALDMRLTDFRSRLAFTDDNVNYKIYAYSIQGVA